MRCEVEDIKGTIKHLDMDGDSMQIEMQDGTKYLFEHTQDCCETVYIYDIYGEPHRLKGQCLLLVEENVTCDRPLDVEAKDVSADFSETWTTYIFKTDSESLVVRWFGTSNGYYSESVDISKFESNE